MAKRLIKHSKLTNRQIGMIIDLFVLEVPAYRAAKHMRINRHSVERVYKAIRTSIARLCADMSPFPKNGHTKEVQREDASTFGVLEHNDLVFTKPLQTVTQETIDHIAKTGTVPLALLQTDDLGLFHALIVNGKTYHGIKRKKQDEHRVQQVENFWGYTKTKLKTYYGVHKKHYDLYMKEMEFRFNHRNHPNLGQRIRNILKTA